jgi:hypothetical protein
LHNHLREVLRLNLQRPMVGTLEQTRSLPSLLSMAMAGLHRTTSPNSWAGQYSEFDFLYLMNQRFATAGTTGEQHGHRND